MAALFVKLSPFLVLIFLAVCLELASAGGKEFSIANLAIAMAYTILSYVLSGIIVVAVTSIFFGLIWAIFGWARKPIVFVGLPIAITATVWGGIALLTNNVSVWGILITYMILFGIMDVIKQSAPEKQNGCEDNDHEAKEAGLN